MTKSYPGNKKRAALRRGIFAEWKAAAFLVCKGYRICAVRYRTKLGEIDIIARKGNLVAMVEVKARQEVMIAFDSVTALSKRRIADSADIWLSRQPNAEKLSIRFDIIAVVPWRIPAHFPDAF